MSDYYRRTYYQDPEVAESYDAKRFAHRRGIQRDAALRHALDRALLLIDARSILDLPCGTGRLTRFLKDRGYQYFGADIAAEMLSVLLRREAPSDEQPVLVRCDGEAIGLKNDSIDCVLCIRLFQLEIPIDVKRHILAEMRRVSSKWLIIEHMYVRTSRLGKLRYRLNNIFGRKNEQSVLDAEVLNAGWQEFDRIPLKGMKNWIGIYRKMGQPS